MKTPSTLIMTTTSALMYQRDCSESITIRPFESSDQPALERLCRHVYDGRDYLPHTSQALIEDPLSEFLILQHDSQLVAVANARRLDINNMVWLEAVRTCPTQRGRGWATRLVQDIVYKCQLTNKRLISCTVASNQAMQKVFRRVGLQPMGSLHQLSFATLMTLEGYAAGDDRPAKSLLMALGIDNAQESGAAANNWVLVESLDELRQVLVSIRLHGGLGHLPGLYEVLSLSQLQACLDNKYVYKNPQETAVMALVKDDKIQSLSSPWVCSIAARQAQDAESALWFACQLPDARPFTVAMDGAVNIGESDVLKSLPWAEDACRLFGAVTPDESN